MLEATNALGPFTPAVGCESTSGSTGLTCSATGLTNGTSYWFTVATRNSVGPSAPSGAATVIPFGKAAAPTGLVAMRGNTTAALGWTAPSDNGNGRLITGYVVTVTPAGGTAYAVAEPNSTNVTINGLTNGRSYTFTVHAVTNDVATGDHAGFESVASNAVTPSGVPVVAMKALPATITPVTTAAKVTYSWTGTPKGSPIASYQVFVRRAPFGAVVPGAWTLLATTSATKLVIATRPGETLYVSVRARDAAGTLSGYAPSSQQVTVLLPTGKLALTKKRWIKYGTLDFQATVLGAAAVTPAVAKIRRIYVVAATGLSFGSVTVWIGKTKITTLNLAVAKKAKASPGQIFTIGLTAKQTATLRGSVIVIVAKAGKLVRLGGVGALR